MVEKSKKRKAGTGLGQETKYDSSIPVRAYEYIRGGVSLASCGKMFGVSSTTFFAWMNKHTDLKTAVERAQKFKKGEGTDTFREYIFGRLSPQARKTWKLIHHFEHCRKENKIRALLERKGKYIRQQLFFYAVIHANFNISLALKKVCLSHSQYQAWTQRDADFARLVQELHVHKKNFFEGCLVKQCKDGDSACIIFANKTINRDLGYNDKIELDIKVQRTISTTQEALESLPVEDRKLFLEKIQKSREQKMLSVNDVPQDAIEMKVEDSKDGG